MNFHQGLKSEMEARSKSIAACLELGKTLILAKSPAADEVLGALRGIGGIGGGGPGSRRVPPPPFSCRSKPWRRSCWGRRRSWRRSGTSTGSGCSKVSAGRARMSPEAWGDGEPGRSRPPVHPPTHPSVPQCWRSTSSPRRRWWPTRG